MMINDDSFEFPVVRWRKRTKMSENEVSVPADLNGTEEGTADPGSEVPGISLEKENNDISNPPLSSHLDQEVKPPLTTIKRGMIHVFICINK